MLRLQSVVVRSDSRSRGLSLGQLNSSILLRPAEKQEKSRQQQRADHHQSRGQQPTFPDNSTITPQLLGNGNERTYSQITTPTT